MIQTVSYFIVVVTFISSIYFLYYKSEESSQIMGIATCQFVFVSEKVNVFFNENQNQNQNHEILDINEFLKDNLEPNCPGRLVIGKNELVEDILGFNYSYEKNDDFLIISRVGSINRHFSGPYISKISFKNGVKYRYETSATEE